MFCRSRRKRLSEKIVQEVLTVWQAESARSEESDVISWERGYEQQRAKNFSGVEANPDVLPLTALLSALTASRERCDDFIPSRPRADSIITSTSMSKRLRPSHRRACLSTPFAAIHQKKNRPRRILSGKPAHWNKLCRWKTTSRLLPLISFGVKSPPQKKQTLPPHLTQANDENTPQIDGSLQKRLSRVVIWSQALRGTSNSKRILCNTCWTFGAAPENIIGFLVSSRKDRLTDTAEW